MKNLIKVLVMMMIATMAIAQDESILAYTVIEAEVEEKIEVINVEGIGPIDVGSTIILFSYYGQSVEAYKEIILATTKFLNLNGVEFNNHVLNESEFEINEEINLICAYDRTMNGENVRLGWIVDHNDKVGSLVYLRLKNNIFELKIETILK
ncbi:hypothetical protein OAI90_09120 [Crocinitomicaceae bacterium]|nr:hypothetical protein [Crocinitomicaceae bacterium]